MNDELENMNMERSYRELLINTMAIMDDTYLDLLGLGLELVIFEDKKAGNLPFEHGDLIPVSLDIFEASDISTVRMIACVGHIIHEISFSLRNINMITDEELAPLYGGDNQEPEPLPEPEIAASKEKTMDDYESDVYVRLSDLIFILNANAYWMKYEEEAPGHVYDTFYFPEEETYELLSSDDTNIQILTSLSKSLVPYRNSIYDD